MYNIMSNVETIRVVTYIQMDMFSGTIIIFSKLILRNHLYIHYILLFIN